jgi:hypothetical protein
MLRRCLFAVLVACAGCQTTPKPTPDLQFSRDAKIILATLQFRRDATASPAHADAVLQFEPQKFQLIAWKGPMRWVVVQQRNEQWRIEFPAQNRVFSGRDADHAPARLQIWLRARDAVEKICVADAQIASVDGPDGAKMLLQIHQRR